MKKKTKAWLTAAIVLVFAGLLLFAVGMTEYRWDFSKLNTVEYATNQYSIDETFGSISVDAGDADVFLALSEDGKCSVACSAPSGVIYAAGVREGTLRITRQDDRAWYDYIQIPMENPTITLRLPRQTYDSLAIHGTASGVAVPEAFDFRNVTIHVNTGDVNCCADVGETLCVTAATGDVRITGISAGAAVLNVTTGSVTVTDVDCSGEMKLHTRTGETVLNRVTCGDLTSDGSTGDIVLENVLVSAQISIKRSTGDVSLLSSDAADITVTTGTGHVTGNLLTPKRFVTDAGTGIVDVPTSRGNGTCTVTTGTGNIRFLDVP